MVALPSSYELLEAAPTRADPVNPLTWVDEQGQLAARAIICHMPAPTNERQALEHERAELPGPRSQLPAGA